MGIKVRVELEVVERMHLGDFESWEMKRIKLITKLGIDHN